MKYFLILSFLFLTSQTFAINLNYSPDRLVIKLEDGKSLPKHELIKSSRKLFSNYYVVFSNDIESLKKELGTNKSISKIDYDYKSSSSKLPQLEKKQIKISKSKNVAFNDPYVINQWTLRNMENHGMSVTRTYANRRSSPRQDIIVAVVDTGVDYNHEDLPMWINEGEIAGNGIDDDSNGYIDDIYGINTLVRDSNGNATMNIMDTHSHGTHVSGSIAAIQNNNLGVAGIASRAKIMAIKNCAKQQR